MGWCRTIHAVSALFCALAACASPSSEQGDAGSHACAPAADGGACDDDARLVLPLPVAPPDNLTTPERAQLGRHLFYDRRLSAEQNLSCADCHEQARAFTDGKARPRGTTGQLIARNSMSIVNSAYAASLTHANFILTDLESQALVPMVSENPIELGLSGMDEIVFDRLRAEPRYVDLFASAFPDDADPFRYQRVAFALAAFERTVVSARSAYDEWEHGDAAALSDTAQRGLALFGSERLGCTHCHDGLFFSSAMGVPGDVPTPVFESNGVHTEYPSGNAGLYELTGDEHDIGKFKPASLRNVAVTAPYMFDGSLPTLEAVIDHYARGGAGGPNQSAFVTGFSLSASEREELIAFLESLTDEVVLEDPELSDPWSNPER
ncbi:MAG TPA: MbnH family di-heme enzyme [Polyangiales bacterium]|nr:MbnH family di-heme enzyme [Polyangiales bacterium]